MIVQSYLFIMNLACIAFNTSSLSLYTSYLQKYKCLHAMTPRFHFHLLPKTTKVSFACMATHMHIQASLHPLSCDPCLHASHWPHDLSRIVKLANLNA